MTVLDPPTSQPQWRRVLGIFAMYLIAALVVALCLWSAVGSGVRSPLYIFQLTLCAAAGPLYVITASTTGLTEARYHAVGPTVGAATLLIWLAAVSLLPALRRVPVLIHLLGGALWLFCGVMLLLITGTK